MDGLAHDHPKLSFGSVQPVQDRFSTHDRVRFARLYNHEESGAVWPRKHSVHPEVEEQGVIPDRCGYRPLGLPAKLPELSLCEPALILKRVIGKGRRHLAPTPASTMAHTISTHD